jgi:hypothetical protein
VIFHCIKFTPVKKVTSHLSLLQLQRQ